MELLKYVFLLLIFSTSALAEGQTDETTIFELTEPHVTSSTGIDTEETDVDTHGDIILTGDPVTTDEAMTNQTEELFTTPPDFSTSTETEIQDMSPCSRKPCRNNGTCQDDPNRPYSFTCSCRAGFTGIRCGIEDLCSVSEKGQLCSNGECVYSEAGTSRTCRCYLGMFWNETFKECRIPDPPCFPNPCRNGGICEKSEDTYKCHCKDGYEGPKCELKNECGKNGECINGVCSTNHDGTMKHCNCDDFYYWNIEKHTCDVVAPPCRPNPCQNSGTCLKISPEDYNCSCSEGYSDTNCEIRDFCTSDEDCGEKGVCLVNGSGKERICFCEKGWYLDETSRTCRKNQQPCEPNPCANDGICIPVSAESFNCSCPDEYSGKLCTQRNHCVMDGGNTYCGKAKCVNDFTLGTYYCSCEDGKYFHYANQKCESLDLCPLMNCDDNEICNYSKCICKDHFKWNNVSGLCESDYCASSPCPGHGILCKENRAAEGFTCTCKEGYAFNGTHCNNAFCAASKLNPCDQKCETTEEGYKCACYNEDFELGEDNQTCVYNGVSTCLNKTCVDMACVREDGMDKCICPSGYSEMNGECVDDCSSGRLPRGFCPGRCEPEEKIGFRCVCEGKYVLSKDGITCTVRKMCEKDEIGWSTCTWRQATCVEDWSRPEGYRCECQRGQNKTSQGICQDICDMEENEKHCAMMDASCGINEYGHRICKCRTFFQMNKDGTSCNQPAKHSYLVTLPLDLQEYLSEYQPDKQQNSDFDQQRIHQDVTTSMGSIFPGFMQANLLVCRMKFSYLLCKFELQFQEVSLGELQRLKMPELCFDRKSGLSGKCVLSRSLVLKKGKAQTDVDIKVTNPCEEDLKDDLCGSDTSCSSAPNGKSFNCTCKTGFAFRNKFFPFGDMESTIETCKDINECDDIEACQPNNDCTNTIGSYYCSCKTGYRKSLDPKEEKCVEICNPSPCDHGDCTAVGDHDYECSCDAGFTGSMCNLEDANFKKARTRTVIVGAVLGGILLLTLVLFFAIITRFRKKKYLEDSSQAFYNGTEMDDIGRRNVDIGSINNAFRHE